MIIHIVFWQLHAFAEGNDRASNAQLLKQKLEAMRNTVAGLHRLDVGLDIIGDDNAADVALYTEFEDQESLAAYQAHADHVAMKPFVAAIRSERRVVDYSL